MMLSSFQMEDDFVGFEREEEDIISQLLSEEPGCTLISLVGPAGLGKTALAKLVYESNRVGGQFDIVLASLHPIL